MSSLYPVYHPAMQMDLTSFPTVALSTEAPSAKEEAIHQLGMKKIFLKEGEELLVEPGAMLACENIAFSTHRVSKNIWDAFKRYVFGQEQLFLNCLKGEAGGGWVSFEEAMDEEIAEIPIDPNGAKVQITRGTFLASSPNVTLDSSTTLKDFFRRLNSPFAAGPLMLTVKTTNGQKGKLYIGSISSQIKEVVIHSEDGPTYIDDHHFVAIEGDIKYTLEKVNNSYYQAFISGEGAMFKFLGDGKVYLGNRDLHNNSTVLLTVAKKVFDKAFPYMIIAPFVGAYFLWRHTRFSIKETYPLTGALYEMFRKCESICSSRYGDFSPNEFWSFLENHNFKIEPNSTLSIDCTCHVNKLFAYFFPKS